MRKLVAAMLPLALFLPSPAHAAWPNSPFTNLPVCTAAGTQNAQVITSDGAGGAILAWSDLRGVDADIYAQHILQSGVVDPSWPVDGRQMDTAIGDQFEPQIISDGAGGAIVSWTTLSGAFKVFAQHVLASGVVDPAWPVNGRSLSAAASNQHQTQMLTDRAGGAYVVWSDARSANYDVYVTHLLANGTLDPAWPVNGRLLCGATQDQINPMIVPDGGSGAIVTWADARASAYDIYAQHVLGTGAVDPAWPTDGRAVCTAVGDQLAPRLVSDGAGGAIITWSDPRLVSNNDIYAQHVLASGAVDAAWPANGRALCAATGSQLNPRIVTDAAGGAIVTWSDARVATTDIYAQHVLATGAVDPGWPSDGRAVCTAGNFQSSPDIAVDGAGGAVIGWSDARTDAGDIYLQHVLASGAVDPLWPVDGRAVSTAVGTQINLLLMADGTGGAIATWVDSRNGPNDIYAQRMGPFGYLGTPEPVIASVTDVPNDQGGAVKVSWDASYLDQQSNAELDFYDVLRSLPPNLASARIARGARVRTPGAIGDPQPGDLLATVSGAQTYYWEFLVSIAARHYLSGYSYTAPTAGDSIAGSNPLTAFMVVARNSGLTQYWSSLPSSGYSVDNVAPLAPAPFLGTYSAGTTYLHWNPNVEPDLAGYRLYRGATAGFVPGPGNRIAEQPDTGYADMSGTVSFYKLSAVDVHGNESPVATLSPSGTTDVGNANTPRALAFAAPSPNPARTATTLNYALPHASRVRLGVYDAAGRLVRDLEHGEQAAGEHVASWDLRDAQGHEQGTGVYFARLTADGHTLVRRIAIER